MRKGEHDVEVAGRKNLVLSFLKPSFPGHVLVRRRRRTMAIAAGVIGNAHHAVAVAPVDMAPHTSGAAVLKVR